MCWFLLSSSGHYVWRMSDVTCHCRAILLPPSCTLVSAGGKSQSAEPFPAWQAPSDSHLWPLSDPSSLRIPEELFPFLETVSIILTLGDLWPVIQSKAQQCVLFFLSFLLSNQTDFCPYWWFSSVDTEQIQSLRHVCTSRVLVFRINMHNYLVRKLWIASKHHSETCWSGFTMLTPANNSTVVFSLHFISTWREQCSSISAL